MSQKLSLNGFKWEDDLSRLNEDFIKNYNENSGLGYFLEVGVEYPKQLFGSHKELPFCQKEENQKKQKNLLVVQKTKKNTPFTQEL